MDYTHEFHSVHGLYYHLVLVVAYRYKVLNKTMLKRCREIFADIGASNAIEIQEFNGEADHIHLLLKAKPGTNLLRFINSSKTVTSRYLKKEFPKTKQKLWTERFWTRSYFIATTGDTSIEAVRQYIENQKAQ
jgi:putative transposase